MGKVLRDSAHFVIMFSPKQPIGRVTYDTDATNAHHRATIILKYDNGYCGKAVLLLTPLRYVYAS